MTSRYPEIYRRSLAEPEAFWAEAAEAMHWYKRWDRVLDASRAPYFYRWYAGAECNTCHNALDRHVASGRGEQAALIYDSPMTGIVRAISYRELLDQVARFAGALAAEGVAKGDRVIIYMPMIPEAAIAMLACARLGAIHSVVFGGFAANELAVRIDDSTPKVIVSATGGIEPGRAVPYMPLLGAAIERARHKVKRCIIVERPEIKGELVPGRDTSWGEAMAAAKPHACVPVAATDTLYVLYTSGTTGEPKGVVRDNGGHMVALHWSMKNVYGVDPGEVFWAASDIGWVVGHSYIVYGPLLAGNTAVLYEGKPVGTPDAGAYWRLISQHKVRAMFTAPTAFRAIKRDDPKGDFIRNYDLSAFRTLFLAGERADPDTVKWAETHLQRPVIDHWWQTESGWPMCANYAGLGFLPVKHGSPSKPVPGYDIRVLDEGRNEVKRGEIGAIVVKLPMPPGCFPTLWNAEARYKSAYLEDFPGYYKTGDAGYMDEDGYLYVMTRTDDVINVAGHRLSTGGMEEVLSSHPDVAECAVIGVNDELKGQVPLGFVVLKLGVNRPHAEILKEIVALVREKIGPVAAFKTAAVVQRLPKTRSGKVLRGTMQKIANGENYKQPATIEDPAVLPEIAATLADAGFTGATAAKAI